jgi:flagellar hook protein FlgE
MGSFSTSLSGVEAASQDLAVISNDLSNLDTTAYKDQEANFQDFFYQLLGTDGAGDPTQIGAGSIIGSVMSVFSQGTINSTGIPTDMAIQGDGFFLEQNGTSTLYTRAGNFSQDSNGFLVTSDGGYVLGYPAVDGVISPSQTLAPLQISSGQISAPNATTTIELTMNLDAAGTAAATATGVLSASANPSAGDAVTIGNTTYTFVAAASLSTTTPDEVVIDTTNGLSGTLANLAAAINGVPADSGNTYSKTTVANGQVTATAGTDTLTLTATSPGSAGNGIITSVNMISGSSFGASFGASTLSGGVDDASFSEPVVVYDSLGNSHTLTFQFTKTDANTWSYQITIAGPDVGKGSPQILNSGTIQFNGEGQLISPTVNVTGISLGRLNLTDGANTLNFTWQLYDPTTGAPQITQTAGSSNVSNTQQNGNTSGALQSFNITSNGTIQGVFSNGQTLTLGQVALGTFPNTQGLQLNGDNTFLATPSAGIPSIGTPDSGGRGTIVGQSLESSNADMTTELSNLIVAERNYQANARAISTADQMINYVLTMQP